ncbi:MAG: hypothetical protein MJ188_04680 [Treponema sp.]|nr:hypothetical protein [Treponema sp.]
MKNIKCIFLLIFCLTLTGCFTDSWYFEINGWVLTPSFQEEDVYFEDDNTIVITYKGPCLDIDYILIETSNKKYKKKVSHEIDDKDKKIFITDFDIDKLKGRILIEITEKDNITFKLISCEINEETGDIDFYDFKKHGY